MESGSCECRRPAVKRSPRGPSAGPASAYPIVKTPARILLQRVENPSFRRRPRRGSWLYLADPFPRGPSKPNRATARVMAALPKKRRRSWSNLQGISLSPIGAEGAETHWRPSGGPFRGAGQRCPPASKGRAACPASGGDRIGHRFVVAMSSGALEREAWCVPSGQHLLARHLPRRTAAPRKDVAVVTCARILDPDRRDCGHPAGPAWATQT